MNRFSCIIATRVAERRGEITPEEARTARKSLSSLHGRKTKLPECIKHSGG